jgi:hypothetical protein
MKQRFIPSFCALVRSNLWFVEPEVRRTRGSLVVGFFFKSV